MTYDARAIVRHLVPAALMVFCAACNSPDEPSKPVPAAMKPYVLKALPADVDNRTLIDFGNKLQLVGYDLEPEGIIKGGSTLELELYFKPLERLRPDAEGREWKIVVELLTQHGRPIPDARYETQPGRGRGASALPLSDWRPGNIYVDEARIRVPNPILAREVQLGVSLQRDWTVPARPVEEGAGGASPETDHLLPVDDPDGEGGAPPTFNVPVRLEIIGGPSDENRGILGAYETDFDPVKAKALLEARKAAEEAAKRRLQQRRQQGAPGRPRGRPGRRRPVAPGRPPRPQPPR